MTPFSPPSELQEIPVATREQSGILASTRDECLSPRVRLKCYPEIPVAPGEEHWLLDTSLDEVYGSSLTYPQLGIRGDQVSAYDLYNWLRYLPEFLSPDFYKCPEGIFIFQFTMLFVSFPQSMILRFSVSESTGKLI